MMMVSTNRQFLSNMLWRLFGFLILGGFIAICSCEPVNRKLLLKASEIIECTDNENNTCGTNEAIKTSSSDRENQTWTSREIRQNFLDDNNVAEDFNGDYPSISAKPTIMETRLKKISARKKKKGGYMMLYVLGAMKAALMYGLLQGVAALAGKAILVAKIALALAVAAILKKHDHEKVSYEIVKHPQTSYIQTHSSSIDYDHRSDYGDERNDYVYEHRKRRRTL